MKQHNLIRVTVLYVSLASALSLAAERNTDSDRRLTTGVTAAVSARNTTLNTPIISPTTSSKSNHLQSAEVKTELTEPAVQLTPQSPKTGEQIRWQVVSGGGGQTVSANYVLSATLGQTVAGASASVNYTLNAGYWQHFGAGGCCLSHSADGRTGNVDADPGKGVDIADLSALIDFLYISFTPPTCMQSANIDGDSEGGIDIADLSAIIDYLYISFTPPAVCQ
jgi:hypothetical protein